jgi:hypothetical protein
MTRAVRSFVGSNRGTDAKTDAKMAAKRAAIVPSLGLQRGVPCDVMRRALTCDRDGTATGALGVAPDLLAALPCPIAKDQFHASRAATRLSVLPRFRLITTPTCSSVLQIPAAQQNLSKSLIDPARKISPGAPQRLGFQPRWARPVIIHARAA